MSAIARAPRGAAKRQRRPVKTAPLSRSRVVQPMPAPGETAVVGLSDWATYLRLDEALTKTGHRVRYFNGILEIMSISFPHESLSGHIGRLLEVYCDVRNMDYQTWGSTTQKQEGLAAAEPDESYTFGLEKKDKPELIIEVGLSIGGIDKLELWAALGATEAWIWQNDRLHGFARSEGGPFQPITESRLLPGLKLPWIEAHARLQPSSQAVRAFREHLKTAL